MIVEKRFVPALEAIVGSSQRLAAYRAGSSPWVGTRETHVNANTLAALADRGLVELRRNKRRIVVRPTERALEALAERGIAVPE